jgi:Ser/Thr protein kinase RdoA (MazF antagonist)
MLSRTIFPEELDAVLSHYEIGPLSSPPESGGGTANANMTIQTATGKFFLKRRNPKYAQPSFVAFDHRLMEHLAPFQIGTPLAVQTREGERWLAWERNVYELFPYRSGGAHDRTSLAQLAAAGRSLAAFHQAVRSFPAPSGKEWPRYQDPTRIREGVEAVTPQLKRRLSPADFNYLETQVSLLEREFPEARYHGLPKRVVHGDFHPGNLKFMGDEVSGIFDLDWATIQPRVLDLADGVFLFAGERSTAIDAADIVSLTQTWQPSVQRARVFMDAYLQHEEVAQEEWDVLECVVRARWLYCRIGGMVKLPEERRLEFLLDGLLEPLRALDEQENLF